MHEQKLLKIAYICSILGILFLFYLSQSSELEEKSANKLTDEDIGKIFRMKGRVEKVSVKNESLTLTIQQEITANVVFEADERVPEEGDLIQFKARHNGKFIEGKDIIIDK